MFVTHVTRCVDGYETVWEIPHQPPARKSEKSENTVQKISIAALHGSFFWKVPCLHGQQGNRNWLNFKKTTVSNFLVVDFHTFSLDTQLHSSVILLLLNMCSIPPIRIFIYSCLYASVSILHRFSFTAIWLWPFLSCKPALSVTEYVILHVSIEHLFIITFCLCSSIHSQASLNTPPPSLLSLSVQYIVWHPSI